VKYKHEVVKRAQNLEAKDEAKATIMRSKLAETETRSMRPRSRPRPAV